ncbi:unnamed protein product [Parajaminaea phylloscopi]
MVPSGSMMASARTLRLPALRALPPVAPSSHRLRPPPAWRCADPGALRRQIHSAAARRYSTTALPSATSNTSSASRLLAQAREERSGRWHKGRVFIFLGPLLLVPLVLFDVDDSRNPTPPLTLLSNTDLARSYVVYTICSFPALVDAAPSLLEWASTTSIPGVKWISEALVKLTFFDQFCGGETLPELEGAISRLASQGVGTLLTYSVEAESKGSMALVDGNTSMLHMDLVDEIQRSVDFAASLNEAKGCGCSVAVKVSGLLRDPSALGRVSDAIISRSDFTSSSHDAIHAFDEALGQRKLPLSPQDHASMQELLDSLRRAGHRAREGRVKLIIDAEQSWLQPAIDLLFTELAREFNSLSGIATSNTSSEGASSIADVLRPGDEAPIFYTTLQTSLRRAAPLLQAMINDATSRQYALGVKVVRGAYIDAEHKASAALGLPSPAWSSKDETDACFDTCASTLVEQIAGRGIELQSLSDQKRATHPSVGAMFASHNRASVSAIVSLLRSHGLVDDVSPQNGQSLPEEGTRALLRPEARERICFGQLYGMANDVTDKLSRELLTDSQQFPSVYKYVPYGPTDKVMPYLIRRGKENKSVMQAGPGGGGAVAERKMAMAEMKRRMKGWWSS